jgi:hypothetical protein
MKLFLLKAAFSTTGLQLSALARRFPLCSGLGCDLPLRPHFRQNAVQNKLWGGVYDDQRVILIATAAGKEKPPKR